MTLPTFNRIISLLIAASIDGCVASLLFQGREGKTNPVPAKYAEAEEKRRADALQREAQKVEEIERRIKAGAHIESDISISPQESIKVVAIPCTKILAFRRCTIYSNTASRSSSIACAEPGPDGIVVSTACD